MNRVSVGIIGILLAALVIGALSALFTVNQTQTALVLRLGRVRDVITEPGLHVKIPFIEDVVRYDARILDLDPPPEQVILADQKRIDVDTYTRFRINNPLQFFQAVRTEEAARTRLREIVNNVTRRVLGNAMLLSLLSAEREQMMQDMRNQVNEAAKNLGIDVIDVRIRRADLPPEASQAIYRRMESERQREAAEARAQGIERSQQIRARADRERTVLLAEAQRQSQVLRGQGDGEANRIYADAFGKDPNFFAFYRSLDAYRQSLSSDNTTYVLTPDSDFFRFFSHAPKTR
ncbi:MAG: protease modulator HflC [Rhodospirillaceae bacterium]|nr:protease modulator HflC [Rhodospirillaceae bacterium]